MFRNYCIVAWRNLTRNKAFSFINILGLALGITCSLLIMLWVRDERSMDTFHKNGSQLYQVYERWHYDGKVEAGYSTQGLLAEELKRVIPEIQYASGMERASAPGTQSTFEADGRISKMEGYYAGSDFFKMFSYPLLQGTVNYALNKPGGIAISGKMAEIFFGSPEKAIGKTILFENKESLEVTAVFKNIPSNSSQQFDYLRNWADFVKTNEWVHNWGNIDPLSFIQIRQGTDPAKLESKIKEFIYRYQPKQQSMYTELGLQLYSDRYLHSTFKDGHIDGGRIEYVRLFTLVSVFILLIACINFMNLATARASSRAKEIGIRKVVGAARNSLIMQFVGEAIIMTLLATIIALCLAQVLLPVFNDLTGKTLSLPFYKPLFWLALICLLFITGITAGSYPALFLSSLKPIRVLKGTLKFAPRTIYFRKGLVIFQFTLSIILITCMIIIYRQVDYIQSKNMGFDRDNLVYIPIEGELVKHYSLFKEEALKMPGITSVSKMRNAPTLIEHHTGSIEWEGKDPNVTISFADAVIGYDFVKTMNLKLKEGRDFSPAFGIDSTGYLINETAAERIGYKDPVGQTIRWGNRPGKIIGVLKDFHFNSLHQAIEPLIARLDENWSWGTILLRIKGDKIKETIEGLQKICKEINPKFPFTYQFSDEEYARLYNSEQLVSKLSDYFAFLAVFISCLGLFGLATFAASQRTKEIGVRKVLGASVPAIIRLLTINFLQPVVIALLIAIPVSVYLMHIWLENFAYKISIEWWMLTASGFLSIIIAIFTVSYQAIKAAMKNPVVSLRAE